MQLKEDYLFVKPLHFVLVHLTNEALLSPGWQARRAGQDEDLSHHGPSAGLTAIVLAVFRQAKP